MSINRDFRARLRAGEMLIGTMLTIPVPSVAEILADAGFDWLFVDAEHGPLEVPDVLAITQAVGERIPCLVRVPGLSEVGIKRILDLGVAGIIVPQINSAEEARQAIHYAKYEPLGTRGVGLARAHRYGADFQRYVEEANDETSVVIQAEHIDAVHDIQGIASMDEVDAVLIGPYDLSASMHKMGQVTDEEVLAAIDTVTQTCRKNGKALGYFGVTTEAVQPYVEQGYSLITLGVDAMMLGHTATRMRRSLRDD